MAPLPRHRAQLRLQSRHHRLQASIPLIPTQVRSMKVPGQCPAHQFRRTIPRRTAHLSSSHRNSKNGPIPVSFGLILPSPVRKLPQTPAQSTFDNHPPSTHSHYQPFTSHHLPTINDQLPNPNHQSSGVLLTKEDQLATRNPQRLHPPLPGPANPAKRRPTISFS